MLLILGNITKLIPERLMGLTSLIVAPTEVKSERERERKFSVGVQSGKFPVDCYTGAIIPGLYWTEPMLCRVKYNRDSEVIEN